MSELSFGPQNIVDVGDTILMTVSHGGVNTLVTGKVVEGGTNRCTAEYTWLKGVKVETIRTSVRYSADSSWPLTWTTVASRAKPKLSYPLTMCLDPAVMAKTIAKNKGPISTGTVVAVQVNGHVFPASGPGLSMADVITLAKGIARVIAKKKGHVTSTDVFLEMHARKIPLKGHDPRWMGQVFSTREGWKRVRYARVGSHRRPVSVWKRR